MAEEFQLFDSQMVNELKIFWQLNGMFTASEYGTIHQKISFSHEKIQMKLPFCDLRLIQNIC